MENHLSGFLTTLHISRVAATADAAVNVSVINSGTIKQIEFCILADLDADGELYQVELGTATTMQSRIHDSVGAIATVAEGFYLLTSGAAAMGKHEIIPCNCSIKAGEKLYLHGLLTGCNSCIVTCIVTVV